MAQSAGKLYICSCYFTHNIFLNEHKLHVTYLDDQQFAEDYRNVLQQRNCATEEAYLKVLSDVKSEVERRRNNGKECLRRMKIIKEKYTRFHPHVYSISDSHFDPKFLDVVEYCKSPEANTEGLLDLIREENAPYVYSLPVFTSSFCNLLLEELEHFEQSDVPKGRPNTMNKGGILLSELGFDENFMNLFRAKYLMPISKLLYPEWTGDCGLDSHRAFIVKYTIKEDVELSYHFDNAEVTLNVCIGKKFEGGDLYFGSMKDVGLAPGKNQTYKHVIGQGLLHRAQHMHGAHPITSGERYNLIVWMRSSSVRNKLCPMCNSQPDLVLNEGYGDGFTKTERVEELCNTL